ncbi:DUF3021 domain-containing protein [Companilactobacillus musae]|uniref:DUF3021 domain-containing protein n=1 Tax=Companilactobacillus musae TaxID=1903258 RepID=UPI000E65B7D3|nr:DUF3021 domain-containing protein [Companilactobacillus musae]
MIRKLFKYAVIGLLIGSLTYLAVLTVVGSSIVTSRNIISIWIMSIGIGWISMIFEIEWNMLLEVLIHFIITAGLVMIMTIYNGWWSMHLLAGLLGFLLIYIAVWVGLYVSQLADMKRLNTQIRKRKDKK